MRGGRRSREWSGSERWRRRRPSKSWLLKGVDEGRCNEMAWGLLIFQGGADEDGWDTDVRGEYVKRKLPP